MSAATPAPPPLLQDAAEVESLAALAATDDAPERAVLADALLEAGCLPVAVECGVCGRVLAARAAAPDDDRERRVVLGRALVFLVVRLGVKPGAPAHPCGACARVPTPAEPAAEARQ